ncbi:hypothetical protein [Mycobacterium sp. DL440]|uniref:hypothetical protein n=1 Tax=Mycobacterium sp. DL440 TaxID=2675523 RepID=UPI00142391F1|nr:hypothetical protein [Mycobacterium sp. DL440]
MRRFARWWTIGMVATVAVCTIAGGVIVYLAGRTPSKSVPVFHRGAWQPPAQKVLASPMRQQPVPGWRTHVEDLNLPESSIFGTSDNSAQSDPFVGAVNSNSYFLTSSPRVPDRQWWLVGLDVHTGKQLFSPVSIDAGSRFPHCFVNGPQFVLCLADAVHGETTETTAWVIDAHTGEVVFDGPSELHTTPGSGVQVDQAGIYAVAQIRGEGLYGIGPHAETTWLVPHTAMVSSRISVSAIDTAPPTLAAAQDTTPGSDGMVVFSLADGKVMRPDLGNGNIPGSAVVYPGGFAMEIIADTEYSTPRSVAFFDDGGNRVAETKVSGSLSPFSMSLPIVEDVPVSTVFGANGAGLVQLLDRELTQNAVFVGPRLYAPESNWEGPVKVRKWRQFDLTTGAEGNTCQTNMSGYLANDGSVGLFETVRYEVTGATTFAMDLATCQKLWSVPVSPDSYHRLWRINDTLAELSDDGKELHSLVAPG